MIDDMKKTSWEDDAAEGGIMFGYNIHHNPHHQENMFMQCIPPYTPLLYSKTGVCRGIPIFLIFAPKHRLWVLVRTALARQF